MGENLMVVREFADYDEARMVAALLRQDGMRVVMPPDPRLQMPRLGTPPVRTRSKVNDGLVEVLVEEGNVERARDLADAFLASATPGVFDGEEVQLWQERRRQAAWRSAEHTPRASPFSASW